MLAYWQHIFQFDDQICLIREILGIVMKFSFEVLELRAQVFFLIPTAHIQFLTLLYLHYDLTKSTKICIFLNLLSLLVVYMHYIGSIDSEDEHILIYDLYIDLRGLLSS